MSDKPKANADQTPPLPKLSRASRHPAPSPDSGGVVAKPIVQRESQLPSVLKPHELELHQEDLSDRRFNRLFAWILLGSWMAFSSVSLIFFFLAFSRDASRLEKGTELLKLNGDKVASVLTAATVVDAKVLIALITGTVAQAGAVLLMVGGRFSAKDGLTSKSRSAPKRKVS